MDRRPRRPPPCQPCFPLRPPTFVAHQAVALRNRQRPAHPPAISNARPVSAGCLPCFNSFRLDSDDLTVPAHTKNCLCGLALHLEIANCDHLVSTISKQTRLGLCRVADRYVLQSELTCAIVLCVLLPALNEKIRTLSSRADVIAPYESPGECVRINL